MYSFHSWSSTNACTSSLFSFDSEYTSSFLGTNLSFSLIAWSQTFCTGILLDFAFPNTFLHFQNLLGTNSFTISSFSFFVFLICFPCFISLFLLYSGGHLVILTSPFSQSISGLCAANYGISKITSVLPKSHTSILTLSTCPLKYILHSISCVTVPPLLSIPFTFFIFIGLANFSFLKLYFFTNLLSANNPVALLSSNTFTDIPS